MRTEATAPDDYISRERRRLDKRRVADKTLFVRNVLNSVFIVMALLAMVGVLVFKAGTTGLYASYGLGLAAILVKMAEVLMRMPSMLRKTQYEQRKQEAGT